MSKLDLTADELAVVDAADAEAGAAGDGEAAGAASGSAAPSPVDTAYQLRVIDAALSAIDRADLDLGGLSLSELLAARDRALGR